MQNCFKNEQFLKVKKIPKLKNKQIGNIANKTTEMNKVKEFHKIWKKLKKEKE